MKDLTINLFFHCNAKCIFCVVGLTGGSRATGGLTLEETKQALLEGYHKGCREVTFSGGEPTIYPGLLQAIRYAKDLGYKSTEIKTNGIRLSSFDYTKQLVDAGLDSFSISIHGPTPLVHDGVVGVTRAFDRAVQGATFVKQLGKNLSLPTCIQQDNFKYFPETIELLLSLSPDLCLPTFIEPSGSAAFRFDDVVPWYSEVIPYLNEGITLLRRQNKVAWALHGFPMCMLVGNEQYSFDLFRRQECVGRQNIDYFSFEKNTYRAKGMQCKECLFETVCGGPWKEYVRHRGWGEFSPIQDKTPSEVIPLSRLARSVLVAEAPLELVTSITPGQRGSL